MLSLFTKPPTGMDRACRRRRLHIPMVDRPESLNGRGWHIENHILPAEALPSHAIKLSLEAAGAAASRASS